MENQTAQGLFDIIDSFNDQVISSGKVSTEVIKKFESILGIIFPQGYRLFLEHYGAINIGELCIYGISMPVECEPSIIWALDGLWNVFTEEIPKNLIPIQHLSESRAIVCVECKSIESDNDDASIVLLRYAPKLNEESIVHLNKDFISYLTKVLIDIKSRKTAFSFLEKHVHNFERDYLSIGKLPRNYVWRPYRFCSQDVVLGLTVVQHSVVNNCLEVDVCMTSDVPEFEEGIGAKITTAFLLSEAYKCGGSMEIRFTENVEEHRVPASICELAEKYGVKLKNINAGRISPSESKFLYLAISEFSQSLREQIESLFKEGRLSIERPCYALYHGLWTRSQIEHIILGSSRPESILGGDTWPEQRHLYINDLRHASASIMGGVLDRKLAKRARDTESEALDLEDDVRPLDISFNPDYYAKIYSCSEEMFVPWVKQQSAQIIKPGNVIAVLLRAYDSEDLMRYLESDINLAKELNINMENQGKITSSYVLIPRDFEELPKELKIKLLTDAEKDKVGIIVCPETIVALETDGARRLASSRRMRE